MTIHTGDLGSVTVVGSDHVGWQSTYSTLLVNIVNSDLIDAILSGNVLEPMVRVYLEKLSDGSLTEIGTITTYCRAENKKQSRKGVFSGTLKPEKISSEFTDLFTTESFPSYDYSMVIKAGYIWEGTEVLAPIFKGVSKDRFSSYGRGGGSLNLNGFDYTEKLETTYGTWSGTSYGTAQNLVTAILNDAGLIDYDFSGFTDFSISGVEFVNNNGLEVISRIAGYSVVSWYFDGDGTFIMRDIPTDTDVKYDYSDAPAQSLEIITSSRQILTQVNVVGNGVTIVRQTDSDDVKKYGLINQPIQNTLISTQAEAITAADNLINERRKQKIALTTSFNPFIYIDDIISVSHQEIGDDQKYRITGFTHWFNGQSAKTRMEAEEVNPTLPTILTVGA